MYRKDRNIHGGEILILIEKSIPSSILEIRYQFFGSYWGYFTLILGAFYTPPNSTPSAWEDLTDCLTVQYQALVNMMWLLQN